MIVELLTFGNELLDGRRIDSNTAWLGRKFSLMGFSPKYRVSTNDVLEDVSEAFEQAIARSNVIVSTGGLGPTKDDLTFEALALALGEPLTLRENLWQSIQDKFSKRNMPCPPSNKRQAMLPKSAMQLPNDLGTAPGLYVQVKGKHIFCFPGVPVEMEFIFENSVRVILDQVFQKTQRSYELGYFFSGISESLLESELESTGIRNYPNAVVDIAYTASFPQVDVTLSVVPREGISIETVRTDLERMMFSSLEPFFLSRSQEPIEKSIIDCLKAKNLKLAVAESMTGGMLMSRLVSVSGCSSVLDASVVTYSNDMKEKLLDVSPATLKRVGAVSKECAYEMAKGVSLKFGADIGISTTGIAGPTGATSHKPVGLTYIAMAGPFFEKQGIEKGIVKEFHFKWDRNKNRTITVMESLKMLWKSINR